MDFNIWGGSNFYSNDQIHTGSVQCSFVVFSRESMRNGANRWHLGGISDLMRMTTVRGRIARTRERHLWAQESNPLLSNNKGQFLALWSQTAPLPTKHGMYGQYVSRAPPSNGKWKPDPWQELSIRWTMQKWPILFLQYQGKSSDYLFFQFFQNLLYSLFFALLFSIL